MNKRFFLYLLPLLILINTLLLSSEIGNTFINWTINICLIGVVLWYKKLFFNPINRQDYTIISLYLLWMVITSIRGMFVAENYWEWKQWTDGTLVLALPIFVYVFSIPWLLHGVLNIWFKYAIPIFFVFFIWFLRPTVYHFYLGPVFLVSCFFPVLKRKWQFIFFILLVLMVFADLGARSQVIKSIFSLLMIIAYIIAKYVSDKGLKIAHWLLYITPVILVYLGLSGIFNVFTGLASNEGKFTESRIVNGQLEQEDLSADTRSVIYSEVIESALKHKYVLWGRTPARGNDSFILGAHMAETLKTGRYERHGNEVAFLNVFTWIGLIGLILYSFIYLKSSYLSIYKSKNIFMKIVGVFIAFHFAYGWVEDINRFDIMNLSIWMMIAMGFSEQFREMNNSDFRNWVRATT